MKNIFPSVWLLAIASCWVLTGCQTPSGMSRLTVTDGKEMGLQWPTPKANFAYGEFPFVRVIGCEGKNFTLQVVNVETQKTVYQHNDFFPNPTIVTGEERITMGHALGIQSEPLVPLRVTPIHVERKHLSVSLGKMSPGAYEARLLIEGQFIEKTAFSVSQ